jgi:mannose-6-phosphate isomerase-like protein (cupin superfamily)
MTSIVKKSFNSPDGITNPGEKLKVELVTVGDIKIQKVTAEPGWKWSKHLKPVVKTETCEKHHLVYVISGKLASRMNDGKEEEFGPGEIGVVPPGHDGWNAGVEPVVWLEIPH